MAIDEVYQEFIDYFEEPFVDKISLSRSGEPLVLENPYDGINFTNCYAIVVHWPTVTITNENDASIDIWDLYCATIVGSDGRFVAGPQFIRGTYDKVQWTHDYMHSHISSIGKNNLSRFHYSCLGRGPINNTIEKLRDEPFDIDVWRLYCWELDKYVHVESLVGVPYKRLQNLGSSSESIIDMNDLIAQPCHIDVVKEAEILPLIDALITYLINNKIFKFTFYNGSYGIAAPYVDIVLAVSNAFIDLYNNTPTLSVAYNVPSLYNYGFLVDAVIKDGKIYVKGDSNVPIEVATGTPLFTFKGEQVVLKLKNEEQDYSANSYIIVRPVFVSRLVYLILKQVNLKYGK